MEFPTRVIVIGVLVIWILVLLYRTVTGRPAWVSLVMAGLLTVGCVYFEMQWRATDEAVQVAVAEVADAVSGSSATPGAHCQRLTESLFFGRAEENMVEFTDSEPSRAIIPWMVCRQVANFMVTGASEPTLDQVKAVQMVAQAAVQLTGEARDDVAQCVAMQYISDAAQSLGADGQVAQSMAEQYWDEVYEQLPENRKVEGCSSHGSLDKKPFDILWP